MATKFNNPLPSDLASEVKKAANIIARFASPEKGRIDRMIPKEILYEINYLSRPKQLNFF